MRKERWWMEERDGGRKREREEIGIDGERENSISEGEAVAVKGGRQGRVVDREEHSKRWREG